MLNTLTENFPAIAIAAIVVIIALGVFMLLKKGTQKLGGTMDTLQQNIESGINEVTPDFGSGI